MDTGSGSLQSSFIHPPLLAASYTFCPLPMLLSLHVLCLSRSLEIGHFHSKCLSAGELHAINSVFTVGCLVLLEEGLTRSEGPGKASLKEVREDRTACPGVLR